MLAKSDEILAGLLNKKGMLSEEQLAEAQEKVNSDKSLAEVLIEDGMIDAEIVTELLDAGDFNVVDLAEYQVNPAAVTVLSETFARRYNVLPIDFERNRLVVAVSDTSNVVVLDDLHIITGYEIKPVIALCSDIETGLNRYYKASDVMRNEVTSTCLEKDNKELASIGNIREVSEDAPVIKLVNMIVVRAVNERASDIHIEPQERDLRIRYRIDGVLHEVMRSPKQIQPGIVSRFKIMGGLDIAETRMPQDGHCNLLVGGNVIDFRVSSLPTIYGERIVLRILRKESILLDLDDLGFSPNNFDRFKDAFTKPYGAILVTGPTGSGKSTTLYATLNVLNNSSKNIITVEDPVEYRLPGINQVQINPKSGLTFARVLRAMLRSSPDIVMVGEMRDKETAQIAIEAALTGHLVLSTLHTNDAPGAVSRLTEMGIAPFLTASAIECVQAQRLARRLCPDCREEYTPAREGLERIGFPLDKGKMPKLYRPNGCPKCNDTGYKGRVGIYEIMPLTDTLKKLCVERATADEIKRVAIGEGMITLRQDGFEKVRQGVTSLEEVMRVIV
ncbi:MAG TPA: ATPase, T2SS/T4P/T4SS family [Candidatus Aquicultor sp.]|jgi:type IV pilus assembly protein PilB